MQCAPCKSVCSVWGADVDSLLQPLFCGVWHPTEEVVISEAGPWDQQEACFCKESAAAPVLGELGIDPRVG